MTKSKTAWRPTLLVVALSLTGVACETQSTQAEAPTPALREVQPPEGFTFRTSRALRLELSEAVIDGAAVELRDPRGRVIVERPEGARGDLSLRFAVARDVDALTLVTRRGGAERRRTLAVPKSGLVKPGAGE